MGLCFPEEGVVGSLAKIQVVPKVNSTTAPAAPHLKFTGKPLPIVATSPSNVPGKEVVVKARRRLGSHPGNPAAFRDLLAPFYSCTGTQRS